MTTAYALGIQDRHGRLEFLRREIFPGNLMRTDSPWYAWTWLSVAEVRLWVDSLPDGSKEQLADRRLLVVPLRIVVGDPTQSLALKTAEPPPRPHEGPQEPPKRTLNTSATLFGDQ